MDLGKALDILNNEHKVHKRFKDKLKIWRDVYYAISLHTTGTCPAYMTGITWVYPPMYICPEYQWLFNNRLMNRHPNEDEASRWYRYSIYRPLTKEPFIRAIGVTGGAIFQDSNWNIELPDKEDNAYIFGNNFHGYDLIGYFANIGMHSIIEDPNGYFVRMPSKPYYEQTSAKVEVEIRFVNTKDIVFLDDKNFIFKDCNYDYAYWITDTAIWRFRLEDGSKKKYNLRPEDAEGYYAHMLGYLPISVAGGEWNSHGYYDSYFDSAKAMCDEFVSSFSAAQVIDKEAAHPYIVAAQEDCPSCDGLKMVKECKTCHLSESSCNCDCTDMPDAYLRFVPAPCDTCGGTGKQSRNPMKWILVPPDQLKEGVDHIKFISPDVAANKHLREVVKELRKDIMQALYLYRSEVTESGEAKKIDLQALHNFLGKISTQLFDKIIYDTIRDIIGYRNVTVTNEGISPRVYEFKVSKPTQFMVKSEYDLLNEYNEGTKLPIVLREKQSQEYANKAYSGDAITLKKMKVAEHVDLCHLNTTDEILSLRVAGAISLQDVKFHQNLTIYMNEILEEKGDDWFIAASIETITDMLELKRNELTDTSDDLPPSEERIIENI